MLFCIGFIWHYALTGLYERWLVYAIGAVLLEGVVWIAYGMRCPLTDWAIALGDDTGADLLSEIVFIEPVNTVPQYAVVFALGLCGAALRKLMASLHPAKDTISQN